MAILHSLKIRSLQDLRAANGKVLARYLTKTEIASLKNRANLSRKTVRGDVLLNAANLPLRAVKVLSEMGMMKLADLATVSESELPAHPTLGKTEFLAILRVCREHSVRLKTQ